MGPAPQTPARPGTHQPKRNIRLQIPPHTVTQFYSRILPPTGHGDTIFSHPPDNGVPPLGSISSSIVVAGQTPSHKARADCGTTSSKKSPNSCRSPLSSHYVRTPSKKTKKVLYLAASKLVQLKVSAVLLALPLTLATATSSPCRAIGTHLVRQSLRPSMPTLGCQSHHRRCQLGDTAWL